jgi:hypothetical protein
MATYLSADTWRLVLTVELLMSMWKFAVDVDVDVAFEAVVPAVCSVH